MVAGKNIKSMKSNEILLSMGVLRTIASYKVSLFSLLLSTVHRLGQSRRPPPPVVHSRAIERTKFFYLFFILYSLEYSRVHLSCFIFRSREKGDHSSGPNDLYTFILTQRSCCTIFEMIPGML